MEATKSQTKASALKAASKDKSSFFSFESSVSAATPFFQPKLTINTPGDVFEQQADAVAENILHNSVHNLITPAAKSVIAPSPIQKDENGPREEEQDPALDGLLILGDNLMENNPLFPGFLDNLKLRLWDNQPDELKGSIIGFGIADALILGTVFALDPHFRGQALNSLEGINLMTPIRLIPNSEFFTPSSFKYNLPAPGHPSYEFTGEFDLTPYFYFLHQHNEAFPVISPRFGLNLDYNPVTQSMRIVGGTVNLDLFNRAIMVQGGVNQFFTPDPTMFLPNDPFEQPVTSMLTLPSEQNRDTRFSITIDVPRLINVIQGVHDTTVQRMANHNEKDKEILRKAADDIQGESNNAVLQINRKEAADIEGEAAMDIVQEVLSMPGNKLDGSTQQFMEDRFEQDFSDVKIHNNSTAHESSDSINALAYTHKNQIVFAAGQYNPSSAEGKKLLAHELTHVVQQGNGVAKKPDNNLVQRVDVPAASHYLSFNQILTKSLSQFISYINTQADWFSAPSLTEDQREEIELMVFFANNDVQAVFGAKTFQQFYTLFNTDGELADQRKSRLQAYAAAASARKYPFEISNFAANLTQAIAIGGDILKLLEGFPDYVLHTAMKEEEFRDLRTHNFISDLLTYYTTATQRPVFQAQNGKDFSSFILFRLSGTSPLHYDSTALVNRIRNYHRFEKAALDRLITNFGNTSKTLPLTLILHTALDHNGAFHRDPNLTAVITNNTMLALMVEGFESLSLMQPQIGPLANTYGINNRIDQLMFAGHGNARLIQLAGTVEEAISGTGEGRLVEQNDAMDLDSNVAQTERLIDEVLLYMDNDSTLPADRQPHARIVFNACLTGSNAVSEAISEGDVAGARAHVSTFIREHASLATFLDNYAASHNAANLTSIGSNASFAQVSLINAQNELDIISAGDPAITAPKIDYVERGTETAGALRAVLESWAGNVANTLDAMRRRLATTETNNWNVLLIRKAYQLILANFSGNAEKIRIVGTAAEPVAELRFEANCNIEKGDRRTANFWSADTSTDDFFADLVSAVSTASQFTGNDRIKLTILQLWLMKAAAKDADFMTGLAAATVNRMLNFTDIDFLENNNDALERLFTSSNNAAKLRLALIGVLGVNNNDRCRDYLIGLLAGATTFPAALHIDAALGGAAAQSEIIDTLGVNATTTGGGGSSGSGTTTHTANVRLHGETTNTLFITPIHQYMEFVGYLVIILRDRPDPTGQLVADVSGQRNFYVIGETADYYAVQHLYEGETIPSVAFIRKRTGKYVSVTNLNP